MASINVARLRSSMIASLGYQVVTRRSLPLMTTSTRNFALEANCAAVNTGRLRVTHRENYQQIWIRGMAGHNKWSKIKHKKAANDAHRSNVFSKLIRDVMHAVRGIITDL